MAGTDPVNFMEVQFSEKFANVDKVLARNYDIRKILYEYRCID